MNRSSMTSPATTRRRPARRATRSRARRESSAARVNVKDLTSSITTIKSDEIGTVPSGQAMQSLQGKVAGLNVIGNGGPGNSPTIRLRGIGSFPGTNTGASNEAPLFVVDGMFFDNIDFLNPADIATISVLKDAS